MRSLLPWVLAAASACHTVAPYANTDASGPRDAAADRGTVLDGTGDRGPRDAGDLGSLPDGRPRDGATDLVLARDAQPLCAPGCTLGCTSTGSCLAVSNVTAAQLSAVSSCGDLRLDAPALLDTTTCEAKQLTGPCGGTHGKLRLVQSGGGQPACLWVLRTLTVDSQLNVRGTAPLIIVADRVEITSGNGIDLTASQSTAGAGGYAAGLGPASGTSCGCSIAASDDCGGGGGGNGTAGGSGGADISACATPPTGGGTIANPFSPLVGGSGGASGGNIHATATAGTGGGGGGAIQLSARERLRLDGKIVATGGGGGGATANDSSAGGGGGGAGGTILLESFDVSGSGCLTTKGGAGGGGVHADAGDTESSQAGEDGPVNCNADAASGGKGVRGTTGAVTDGGDGATLLQDGVSALGVVAPRVGGAGAGGGGGGMGQVGLRCPSCGSISLKVAGRLVRLP
ncbi:MAG: hypothetical protein IT371_08750 [Deltaproteobacteria bacterium]|nr:hypothetical protein [Deltaproteobacteria bacterium]